MKVMIVFTAVCRRTDGSFFTKTAHCEARKYHNDRALLKATDYHLSNFVKKLMFEGAVQISHSTSTISVP